jgi:glycosyltransferase involved in cell wall biosynthesis
MKILIAHNFYQQSGGEDGVFFAETALLEKHGHNPLRYVLHNNQIEKITRITLAGKTIWNREVHHELRDLVRSQGIDVVHFHNTFPLISPAAYSAVRKEGAAVVQTLHNYRILCPSAVFFRDGQVCEECLHKTWKKPAIKHKCYRGSRSATATLAASLALHHNRGTFDKDVDLYIAPSAGVRDRFVEAGTRSEQIVIKPHFIDPDPGVREGGNYAVFVGRLSFEKGLETLLAAWEKLPGQVPLKIIGDGPLREKVLALAKSMPHIQWLGRKPMQEIYDIVGNAACLIFPSRCYETFGRVAIEAYAVGTPVIASNHGAMADVVNENTGMLFKPGDPGDLARTIETFMADPTIFRGLRRFCRNEFLAKYQGDQN